MRNVSLTTTGASANARSTSPIAWVKPTPTLVPHAGWISGPPGSAAARGVGAGGVVGRLADVEREGGREPRRHGAEERQGLHPALEVGEGEDGGEAGGGPGPGGPERPGERPGGGGDAGS